MKRIVIAALLLAFAAAPALAADKSKLSVGASYGLGGVSGSGGVFSFRGDYDISDKANAPVKVRVGWDHYSVDLGVPGSFSCNPVTFVCGAGPGGNITWSTNVFYGGAYYDFNKMMKLDKKIHPFAGLGFGFGSTTVSCPGGLNCNGWSSPTVGGFYYIGGVQYEVTPQIAAELGFSGWTGISIGANFKF